MVMGGPEKRGKLAVLLTAFSTQLPTGVLPSGPSAWPFFTRPVLPLIVTDTVTSPTRLCFLQQRATAGLDRFMPADT